MSSFSVIKDFEVHRNDSFLEKADQDKPVLLHKVFYPEAAVNVEWKKGKYSASDAFPYEDLHNQQYGRSGRFRLDFGDHHVGYLTMKITPHGSHPDAPLMLHIKFGQNLQDLMAKSRNYRGWLSKSWIQEEYIHIDTLPAVVTLPRRYAFRYISVRVIDTSEKYTVSFDEISVDAVSAVSRSAVESVDFGDDMLNQIDRVGIKTLQDCMQDVLEDGPKRDRRLWLGDLRLQALANYASFKDYGLIRRCLYLFAGLPFNEGKISSCLFTEPAYAPDDTYLVDYALLFVPALYDYMQASGDQQTLDDLYPIAQKQIDIVAQTLNREGVLDDLGQSFWCFLDWGDELNKQAGANAVLLYAIRYGIRLAEMKNDTKRAASLSKLQARLKNSVLRAFWDEEQKLFVSGANRQVSWATQIWMVHAEVLDPEESRELLLHTINVNPPVRMQTPYIHHYFVSALLKIGEKERAIEEIRSYWGGMVREGADTFWEVYDPKKPDLSPYGSPMLNSYCHAWSCTPTYLLRKYLREDLPAETSPAREQPR